MPKILSDAEIKKLNDEYNGKPYVKECSFVCELTPSEFKDLIHTIKKAREALKPAGELHENISEWHGAKEDKPEGSRYAKVSETLIKKIAFAAKKALGD